MSRFFGEGSIGNALTTAWGTTSSWVFPPFPLIEVTIEKMWEQQAFGALVIPSFDHATWWNQLFLPNGSARMFIHSVWNVGRFDSVVCECTTGRSVALHSQVDLLVLQFDFRCPVGREPRDGRASVGAFCQ